LSSELKLISDFVQKVPGPWWVTLAAAQVGKTLEEPNFGFVQIIASDARIEEDKGVISFVNFNSSRMDIVLAALQNGRRINESTLRFDYFNAVVPLRDFEIESWPVWFLCIEKVPPLSSLELPDLV